MLASPVPIYLGCIGLIVGSLGLGAQHLLGESSGSATKVTAEQRPLLAQSVEQASVPAHGWTSQSASQKGESQNAGVAHYDPTAKLTPPPPSQPPTARTAQPPNPPAEVVEPPERAEPVQQEQRATSREVVRDL